MLRKRSTVLILVALVGALTGCSTASPAATVPPSPSASPSAAAVTVPDATGKDGASARKLFQDLGLLVEFSSDTGRSVIAASNWTVVSTEPAAGAPIPAGGTVVVTVTKPAAEPAVVEQQATSAGLTGTYAQAACDTYGKSQFPYGFKPAWIVGKLADRIENDQWFFKVTAKVKNAYGAQREATVECTVGGTNSAPDVVSFLAY